MISINKTRNLWNKDRGMVNLEDNVGVMCCWYWCWHYMSKL
ncbi:MAG: hypothetical protein ACYCXB_09880 [Candidatus Humimicrobiaceae bacterium]